MHERRAIPVSLRTIRHRMNEGAGSIHDVGGDIGNPVDLIPSIGKAIQKNGHVIVGIRARIATRARPEQHHALDADAVNLIKRGAKTDQDGIDDCHGGNVA
jgi:hypothetical protein